ILKSKTELELQIQNVRRELKNVQITSDQLQKEKSALALEVKNLTREKSDLKRQLDYNQKMMDSIGVELVREKNDKFQIQENLKPVKEENRYLRAQLQALINRKAALEKKLLDWEDKGNTLNNRLSEMESMLKEKSLQIDTLKREIESGGKAGPGTKKEPVELPEIVVRPQAPEEIPVPAVMPESNALTGKVLAVNHDNNFVIIDLGDDAGVNVGNTFTIYRDGSGIASVSVIQTRKNISACDIKREGSPIKVGDIVR
ncbi:MAG: hypothetical protein ACM3IL_05330, partial [Deltaproteobacteria bacterium]